MKTKLMYTHAKLVKNGKYDVANLLLGFITNHSIMLYLSDAHRELQRIFEKLNVRCVCVYISGAGIASEYKY